MEDNLKNRQDINKKSSDGITLIALVITIIVLLILAGIAISMLSGENGILRKAAESKEKTEIAAKQEEAILLSMELKIAKSAGENIEDYFEESNYNILNNEINTNDVIYITEGKYAIENTTNNKKYIIDENLDISEATDIINMLQTVVNYIKDNPDFTGTMSDISADMTESDSKMKEILKGKSYDTGEYHFVIVNKRLLCYPNNSISIPIEILKICEKTGIYLWGDVTEDFVVDDFDHHYLSAKFTDISKMDKTTKLFIISDLNATNTVNLQDINPILRLVTNRYKDIYKDYIEKIYQEYQDAIDKKVENGVIKSEINSTDTDIKTVYLPSYDEKLWDFKIIKGNLVIMPFGKMTTYKIQLCNEVKQIKLYGDINGDYVVQNGDIDYLKTLVEQTKNGTTFPETVVTPGDLNFNGELDDEDIGILQQIIDGTFK